MTCSPSRPRRASGLSTTRMCWSPSTTSTIACGFHSGCPMLAPPRMHLRMQSAALLPPPTCCTPHAASLTHPATLFGAAEAQAKRKDRLQIEMSEPRLDDIFEPLFLQPIDLVTTGALHDHEPGTAQHRQVAGHGRPRARVPAGDLAGRHRLAADVQVEEDVPANGMADRFQRGIETG